MRKGWLRGSKTSGKSSRYARISHRRLLQRCACLRASPNALARSCTSAPSSERWRVFAANDKGLVGRFLGFRRFTNHCIGRCRQAVGANLALQRARRLLPWAKRRSPIWQARHGLSDRKTKNGRRRRSTVRTLISALANRAETSGPSRDRLTRQPQEHQHSVAEGGMRDRLPAARDS
jgi:hypothetical protein